MDEAKEDTSQRPRQEISPNPQSSVGHNPITPGTNRSDKGSKFQNDSQDSADASRPAKSHVTLEPSSKPPKKTVPSNFKLVAKTRPVSTKSPKSNKASNKSRSALNSGGKKLPADKGKSKAKSKPSGGAKASSLAKTASVSPNDQHVPPSEDMNALCLLAQRFLKLMKVCSKVRTSELIAFGCL